MLSLFVGVFLALLARTKGYSPYFWFFGGAFIGYGILSFLPDVTPVMGRERPGGPRKRQIGNGIGVVLSVLTLAFEVWAFSLMSGRPGGAGGGGP